MARNQVTKQLQDLANKIHAKANHALDHIFIKKIMHMDKLVSQVCYIHIINS